MYKNATNNRLCFIDNYIHDCTCIFICNSRNSINTFMQYTIFEPLKLILIAL